MQPRILALVGDTRVGSTVVGEAFERALPDASFVGEIFYPAIEGNPHGFFRYLHDSDTSATDLLLHKGEVLARYFEFLIRERQDFSILCVDIKIHDLAMFASVPSTPLSENLLFQELQRRDATAVSISRDHIDAALSEVVASTTGQHHLHVSEATTAEPLTVSVDPLRMVWSVKTRIANASFLKAQAETNGIELRTVKYCGHDIARTVQDVLSIVGRRERVETHHITRQRLSERIHPADPRILEAVKLSVRALISGGL